MAELEVYNSVLRTREGAIFGLRVTQNFFFMKSPKMCISITNPPSKEKGDGKARFARIYLDTEEIIEMIRKLKRGVAHTRTSQARMELYKAYKGGPDYKHRYGVDIVARIFSLYADKGRLFMKIDISNGKQVQTKNKLGQLVPGVVKPAGGPTLEAVSFSLNEDKALNLAFVLEKEYEAWRCALVSDYMRNPDKYAFHPNHAAQVQKPGPSSSDEEPEFPPSVFF